MNTFGHLLRVTTFGESHGPAIGCVLDGCPPGIAIAPADFAHDLKRRATGNSRHVSQRHEADEVEILSGVYEGCEQQADGNGSEAGATSGHGRSPRVGSGYRRGPAAGPAYRGIEKSCMVTLGSSQRVVAGRRHCLTP